MSPATTRGPAFLGIGAQKAGTTWLWENLRLHPKVWMPLVKELHWFDVVHPPALFSEDHLYQPRRGLSRYYPLRRNPSLGELKWLWRFYHGTHHDQDYLALLERRDGRLAGEITPAYSALDADTVLWMRGLLRPDCRIVFVMREPVSRLWSAVRMECRSRGIDPVTLSEDSLDALSQSPGMLLRSDYERTIDHWLVFGDRLGLFFYEDMRTDPAGFLRGVLEFLGVDAAWRSPKLNHISNSGESSLKLPRPLANRWRDRYAPTVAAVGARMGRLPASWKG